MTRQVAIAALIAFAVTVLGISIWEPRPEAAPVAPAPVAAPAEAEGSKGVAFKAGLVLKRGERFGATIKSPTLERRIEARAVELFGTDAGTP